MPRSLARADPLTAGTLVGEGTDERTIAIERDALDAALFPVDIRLPVANSSCSPVAPVFSGMRWEREPEVG